MLTVFNVGQGDCCLLNPGLGCDLGSPPLLIDTGPSSARIFGRLADIPAYQLMITHSHNDHIGGLPALLRAHPPQRIYIPYWLPEIDRISVYLRKRVSSKIKTLAWRRLCRIPFCLVAHGDTLCGHATILNPPRQPDTVFATIRRETKTAEKIDQTQISEPTGDNDAALRAALANLRERGLELPEAEIERYRSPVLPEGDAAIDSPLAQEYGAQARRFVHLFFIELSRLTASTGGTTIDYDAARMLELTANQVSAVLRYGQDEHTFLFTGDADTLAFDRLIDENTDLSARILKVPHHGSRENLSARTLRAIAPRCAIVSHNNRRFGRSRDPHPHHEVIDLLDLHGIDAHYTNAVVKQRKVIKQAASGSLLGGLIHFV